MYLLLALTALQENKRENEYNNGEKGRHIGMRVNKERFGRLKGIGEASLYTIENETGMKAVVTDFGAALVSLYVTDKEGKERDVVLGYDRLENYQSNFDMLGVTVGRNVNRIEKGRFCIDKVTYQLDINENDNNIHSHMEHGFHKVLWRAVMVADNEISFMYHSPDGENGFPGNLDMTVTYTVTEGNGLLLSYHGSCDKKTLINPANHTYFNLAGYASGDILDTEIWINADSYTPIRNGMIPTGEIVTVEGTPMDFQQQKAIGQDINKDFEQLQLAYGYDHNYVLKNQNSGVRKAATAFSPRSGIGMTLYTDLPGLQFYTGNTTRDIQGKNNSLITRYCGFCMESQYYPNSVNIENFPQPVFDAGRDYRSTTLYHFW